MEVLYKHFGLYCVNIDYVAYFHAHDNEVRYTESENYKRKPYLGIFIHLGNMSYCAPLTSAKPKMLEEPMETDHSIQIYEQVMKTSLRPHDIYKCDMRSGDCLKMLATLEINKMIPVDDALVSNISFSALSDTSYANLLRKEYDFLRHKRDQIMYKTEEFYVNQKTSRIVEPKSCDFHKLECAYVQFKKAKTI